MSTGSLVNIWGKYYPKLFKSTRNIQFPKSFVISDILAEKWNYVKKWFAAKDNFSTEEKNILMQTATALRDSSAQIVAGHLVALNEVANLNNNTGQINISSDGPIIQYMPGWKEKFMQEIDFISNRQLAVKIKETAYQGRMNDLRGIFDVIYLAIEYFARVNK